MPSKKDPAERTAARRAKRQERGQKFRQVWQAFQMQRREDKALVPLMLAAVIVVTAVALGVGFLFGQPWLFVPVGLMLGILVAVIIFGRRVQANVYRKAAGQPGAAGWALDTMRGGWRVTQAVAGTTQLDAVHRVIGRPGVVLVGEGQPHRVKGLIAQEKKRVSRIVGEVPIYDLQVGEEEDQVPLRKLQRRMSKLPRNIDRKQMDVVEKRLAALASRSGAQAAMPKGPAPQGAKMRSLQRTARRR